MFRNNTYHASDDDGVIHKKKLNYITDIFNLYKVKKYIIIPMSQ